MAQVQLIGTHQTSLVAQMVKCLSTMWKTWVRPLGWEDPLEKEMAVHSSTVAWKIPWTEKPVGYSPWGRKESDTTERLHFTSLQTFKVHLPSSSSYPVSSFIPGLFSITPLELSPLSIVMGITDTNLFQVTI